MANTDSNLNTGKEKQSKRKCIIVGVGASAGGLEALQELISHLPGDLEDIAVVVTQHLSPTYKSMLVQLLGRQTKLEVTEIKHHLPVVAGKIYITPPDSEVTLSKNYFQLHKPKVSAGPKPSVDAFFRSLAEEKKKDAVGIILSGTGSDGANGMRAIKKEGGLTVAQEPQTAKYDGMPIAAIETGYVDLVLSPDKIGEELKELLLSSPSKVDIIPEDQKVASHLDKLLSILSKRTGTDFANYKPSTICRRLEKRLTELKIGSVEKYLDHIHDHPKELDTLFNNILIGVTTFFRDPEAFRTLEANLTKVIAKKRKDDPLRIWLPGCASGEEAYSIAITIAQLINNRFQDYQIQIFATDIDEHAINNARKALYNKSQLENLPEGVLGKYFLKKGEQYEVIKSIRQLILFSKHDVTSNPPFLKLDLISCRNLLIYFGQGLQKHVIPIFHYALNTDGLLFLGKSETVGQFTDLFSTLEGKSKIFQRKRGNYLHGIKFTAFKPRNYYGTSSEQNKQNPVPQTSRKDLSIPDMVKETIYNTFEHSYVVVNDSMDILEVNGDVRMFLQLSPGSMNANILKLAVKELQIEVRSVLSKAIRENQVIRGELKKVAFFEQNIYVRVIVKPLIYTDPGSGLFVVIFEQIKLEQGFPNTVSELSGESESPRILELEHELASTKEHLQTFVEELETANEELQSLNEELQSSNEELQSSNEELETSNEELQSTNEELQIAYTELKATTEELENQTKKVEESEANALALLSNKLQAFMLINQDYRIIAFNETALHYTKQVFDKPLKKQQSIIDYQMPGELEAFRANFKRALAGDTISGVNQVILPIGQEYWFKYNFTPINTTEGIDAVSYSILDISDHKRIEKELAENEDLINSIFNAADIGICVTNSEGKFVKVNQAYCDIYGYGMEEIVNQPFTMVLAEEHREMAQDMHDRYLEGEPETPGIWEVMRKNGELITVKVTASRLVFENNKKFKITTVSPITQGEQAFINK